MKFVLDFTESAIEDLDYFKKYEQNIILDAIAQQLQYQPDLPTHNRKGLDINRLIRWGLCVGIYRVFYGIIYDTALVKIKSVGCKQHNTLYIRGKAYTL